MQALANRAGSVLVAHPRLAALGFGLVAATGFQPLQIWPLAMAGLAGPVPDRGRTRHSKDLTQNTWDL